MVNVIIDITYRGNFHRGDCNDQNQWSNCPKLEIENVIMTIKKEEKCLHNIEIYENLVLEYKITFLTLKVKSRTLTWLMLMFFMIE